MKYYRKYLFIAILASSLLFFLSGSYMQQRDVPVNIILFIGDGMGVSHIAAAKTVNGSLAME